MCKMMRKFIKYIVFAMVSSILFFSCEKNNTEILKQLHAAQVVDSIIVCNNLVTVNIQSVTELDSASTRGGVEYNLNDIVQPDNPLRLAVIKRKKCVNIKNTRAASDEVVIMQFVEDASGIWRLVKAITTSYAPQNLSSTERLVNAPSVIVASAGYDDAYNIVMNFKNKVKVDYTLDDLKKISTTIFSESCYSGAVYVNVSQTNSINLILQSNCIILKGLNSMPDVTVKIDEILSNGTRSRQDGKFSYRSTFIVSNVPEKLYPFNYIVEKQEGPLLSYLPTDTKLKTHSLSCWVNQGVNFRFPRVYYKEGYNLTSSTPIMNLKINVDIYSNKYFTPSGFVSNISYSKIYLLKKVDANMSEKWQFFSWDCTYPIVFRGYHPSNQSTSFNGKTFADPSTWMGMYLINANFSTGSTKEEKLSFDLPGYQELIFSVSSPCKTPVKSVVGESSCLPVFNFNSY